MRAMNLSFPSSLLVLSNKKCMAYCFTSSFCALLTSKMRATISEMDASLSLVLLIDGVIV